jgi:hypothetical protein
MKLFAEEGEYDREMAYMGVIINEPHTNELKLKDKAQELRTKL